MIAALADAGGALGRAGLPGARAADCAAFVLDEPA